MVPSTVTVWPVLITVVPTLVPTTAGRPNSRATIALCDSTPPTSETTAPAIENSGTHGGSVISHDHDLALLEVVESPGRASARPGPVPV